MWFRAATRHADAAKELVRRNSLQAITVIVIVMGAVNLAILDRFTEFVATFLGAIAGFVLGDLRARGANSPVDSERGEPR
jgi:hypothetical protein